MLSIVKGDVPPKAQSPAQQVREEIEVRAVAMLVRGSWLTDTVVDMLLKEAQDTALLHVMDGLPPDLRTLASHRRDDLRVLVNRRLLEAATRQQEV